MTTLEILKNLMKRKRVSLLLFISFPKNSDINLALHSNFVFNLEVLKCELFDLSYHFFISTYLQKLTAGFP